MALTKALISSDFQFPEKGRGILLSLRDKDKMPLFSYIQELVKAGYTLSATQKTFDFVHKTWFRM